MLPFTSIPKEKFLEGYGELSQEEKRAIKRERRIKRLKLKKYREKLENATIEMAKIMLVSRLDESYVTIPSRLLHKNNKKYFEEVINLLEHVLNDTDDSHVKFIVDTGMLGNKNKALRLRIDLDHLNSEV